MSRGTPRADRAWLPLGMAGAAAMVFVWLMALVSASWPAQGEAVTLANLWPYWAGFALSWAALTWLAVTQLRGGAVAGDGAAAGHAALVVLLGALLLRLVTVATTSPVLSDDIWRYILDGRTLAGGDNPYRLSPLERADEAPIGWAEATEHAQTLELVERINHPHLVTIYQPASQWVFAMLYRAGAIVSNPFRLGFSAADLAIVALLLVGLRSMGASPWWAVLYAWHPLAISETAGSGHQDVLGVLPLLGALILCRTALPHPAATDAADARRRTSTWLYGTLAQSTAVGGLFALALAVKPVVAPLALPLAWTLTAGRPWRHATTALAMIAVVGGVVLAALYVPFVMMPGGLDGMIETGRTFIDAWAFNGSVHAMLSNWFHGGPVPDWICAGLLVAVLLMVMALRLDIIETAMTYLFASLLLSSTAHPWYLLWALSLTPLRPRFAVTPAVWVWSLTITWSYAAHAVTGYRLPTWVAAVEYLPVFAALAAGVWVMWRRRVEDQGTSPPAIDAGR